jgi:hypothetical protein
MFKLVKQIEKLEWPVTVKVPTAGGKTESHTFTAHFRVIPQKQYEKALRESADDATFISKFLVGWDGVNGENDKPLTFSKKNLNDMCGMPFIRTAIIKAYSEAASGIEIKN